MLLVFLLLKKVLFASSYGHLIATKEFWPQCHIFRFGNNGVLSVCSRAGLPVSVYPVELACQGFSGPALCVGIGD